MNTYESSGVNRNSANEAKELIAKAVSEIHGNSAASLIGKFGASFDISKYTSPILISSTDGVGTKTKLTSMTNYYDNIGFDIVNACVNDILVNRGKPLFFLDYIGTSEIIPDTIGKIAKSIASACLENECQLIGGETAEMPGIYTGKDFDLVGFVVGVLDNSLICRDEEIQEGDLLIGVPSNGIHTNGFSLIRKVFDLDTNPSRLSKFEPSLNSTLGEELLKPHISYLKETKKSAQQIKAMCHITGGGFYENLPRVIPSNFTAKLYPESWEIPNIFKLTQNEGNIENKEMWHVFNMGIGMVFIVSPKNLKSILDNIPKSTKIGEITANKNHPVIIDGIE
ncbi:MAG: phosphoribosylformylglycinamidine cyclo-ligase [SAR202 cluster bacterium]|nr:phosphoribosylformylglycinamidine cyclo-ligase [SAR202 cluster bacterium]|tara:strand:+ start:16882 stop:17898 length:1017 start_codon:yes stop_codon:yes gene_type:complete